MEASDRVGDELGLVPRSVRHLFQRKASRSMSIRISNFEIYNEQVWVHARLHSIMLAPCDLLILSPPLGNQCRFMICLAMPELH